MNTTDKITLAIGYYLILMGAFFWFSSMMFGLVVDDLDKSFTREFLSLVCFGFSGIILSLKNKTKE